MRKLELPAGRVMDISLRRCAGERNILRNMKPTFKALLALGLCVVGCSTFNDVGKHLWRSGPEKRQLSNKTKTEIATKGSESEAAKANSFNKERMVWISAGTFKMGSTTGQKDEQPLHRVELNH